MKTLIVVLGPTGVQEKKTRVREYIKRFLIPVSVAACLLLAYVIDKGEFSDNSWTLDAYVGQLADVAEASGQVQLLLSDKRKVQIDKDTVGIVYSSNGKIQIEQEEHTVSETSENTDEAKGFNQIIVPKGKYSQLTLSDGTRMHVNSGTWLSTIPYFRNMALPSTRDMEPQRTLRH